MAITPACAGHAHVSADTFRGLRWLWLAAAGATATLCLLLLNATQQPLVDYAAYRDGSVALLTGARLYAPALVWRDVGFSPLYPAAMPTEGYPFVYPPSFALAFVPFALLPVWFSIGAWLAVVFGSLLGASYLLVDLLLRPATQTRRLLMTVVLAGVVGLAQPIRAILVTGQADSVLILLLTLTLVAFVKRTDARGGLWLALAIAIKPTLGALIVFFLWKRAYRAALSCCLVAAPLLLFTSALAGGLGTMLDYLQVAAYWSSPTFAVSPINQAPYGLVLRLLTLNAFTQPILEAPALAAILRAVLVVLTAVVLAGAIRRRRDMPASRGAVEYGILVVGLLVASPLSEAGNYGYLVLPLVALGAWIWTGRRGRQLRVTRHLAVGLGLAYVCLCLPSLTTLDMAFYAYWQAPVQAPLMLLTGTHVYILAFVAALALIAARSRTFRLND
jgi:hypothetical protein